MFELFTVLACIGVIWLWRRLQTAEYEISLLSQTLQGLERRLAADKKERSAPKPVQTPPSSSADADTATEARPFNPDADQAAAFAKQPTFATPPLPPLPDLPAAAAVARGFAESTENEPAPSAPPIMPPLIPLPPRPAKVDWERFMGVKLFAWIGGLALFLGVAFFIKYSFENNLVSPVVRVAMGFVAGLGLTIGGWILKRREYAVTAQTLCATGIVILYAVSFACHAFYKFFGPGPVFALMCLITAAAFFLAARMDARVVAVLGLVGGFLTPFLLPPAEGRTLGLFGYVGFLNVGLAALAFHRGWHFLFALGAFGTACTQIAWVIRAFHPSQIWVAEMVLSSFALLQVGLIAVAERLRQSSRWLSGAAVGLPLLALVFSLYFLGFGALGARPGVIFGFVFLFDLCLLAMAVLRKELQPAHLAAGTLVFSALAGWTLGYLTNPLLGWGLAFYLLFAALHTFFPIFLRRVHPGVSIVGGALFPMAALLLILFTLVQQPSLSWIVWPFVFLVDLIAVGAAFLAGSFAAVLGMLLLTGLLTAVWILQTPPNAGGLAGLLFLIGGFALFFLLIGLFAMKRRPAAAAAGSTAGTGDQTWTKMMAAMENQLPAASVLLPFLLLFMAMARLPLADPSPVFGLALFIILLCFATALLTGVDLVVPVSLGSVFMLQGLWHAQHFQGGAPWIPLVWHLAFWAVYLVFPFVFPDRTRPRTILWACAALAGAVAFWFVYQEARVAFPRLPMGLVPAAFSLPLLLGLAKVRRIFPAESPNRNAVLAWFGGCALLFLTLIFPIQFERQWITLGWALEGVALLWLFKKVPHPGLRWTGVALLGIAFARLSLNPAVLEYQTRTGVPLLNWYLYAYGVAISCLFLGAKWITPPDVRLGKWPVRSLLLAAGTLLAFILLNIQIADFFSEGPFVTLEFSASFAQGMTYSIAWSLFAIALLALGIWKNAPGARYASLALLSLTLIKLFFHDLTYLAQLYRIGAFIGVAIILILASFLYQRFMGREDAKRQNEA